MAYVLSPAGAGEQAEETSGEAANSSASIESIEAFVALFFRVSTSCMWFLHPERALQVSVRCY